MEQPFIIEPKVFKDSRGHFFESYNKLNSKLVNFNFVQDNVSKSSYGTLRGLHIQNLGHTQSKLVTCLAGSIIDTIVDVRSGHDYGKIYQYELNDKNFNQLLVPKGFVHGFSVISDFAIVQYKCDEYYNKESEQGFHPLSSELDIDWNLSKDDIILSDKDNMLPEFIHKTFFEID